ncbi:hypothetical protein EVAR_6583_1 [Eumeta japonica]|uniref:C2 domain-containing protein n=1 Tax=Eumeta variegata TaxID=151549 RepID=A0A4C1STM6_EUMVA|nr:hypothetical protein EVAR_6583_1 [Eumeta japonica]
MTGDLTDVVGRLYAAAPRYVIASGRARDVTADGRTPVKLFPGDSKYETTLQESSWPVWNEDFKFQLRQKDGKKTSDGKNDLQGLLAGHFLSLTIYALLEPSRLDADKRKSKTTDKRNSKSSEVDDKEKPKTRFLEKTFSSFKSTKSEAAAQKSVLEKRRTVGAATWNFDSKLFQNDLRNGLIGTPDIWRPVNAINSGMSNLDSRKDLLDRRSRRCGRRLTSERGWALGAGRWAGGD